VPGGAFNGAAARRGCGRVPAREHARPRPAWFAACVQCDWIVGLFVSKAVWAGMEWASLIGVFLKKG
jgi:hypothetical protein